ncbi:N-acetylmuramoyl-L-alanine amidase [Sporanaerobium hydrogeniformans]|uniref:N-acetylmuramoyl-L-alanine amidase n=1 Tax=Sporanaerobium hydrogeniformans TaxID=3072179 RepID=UPI0015D4AB2F|nr:N-acetylmuramoyl-L-alanine amidase [Sporanaerobium hydrogeniformans]
MKKELVKWLILMSFVILSSTILKAEPLQLIYDGKVHNYTLPPITLYINGEMLQTQVMPAIQLEERVLVPAKEVFEKMGASVEWNESEKSVYICKREMLIVLKMNSQEAWVNGIRYTLDMPAKNVNDKMMIPLRFISEAMGYDVIWENGPRNAFILMPEELSFPEEPSFVEQEEVVLLPGAITALTGIYYDALIGAITVDKPSNLCAEDLVCMDDPIDRKWIVDFKADYSAVLKEGVYELNTGPLKKVSIKTDVTTCMIIETQTVQALTIYEMNEKLYFNLVTPREKYDKLILIDPGHGGSAPGTSGGGIVEKNQTLLYGMDFFRLLEEDPSIKVYTTRSQDIDVSLEERAQLANEIMPDLFISIHANAITGTAQRQESVKGTETYYYDNPNDLRGKAFAEMVQQNLVSTFNMVDRKAKADTGYVVLKRTNMPGVIIEVGFLTNSEDRNKMMQPDFSARLATVLYETVKAYYAEGYK